MNGRCGGGLRRRGGQSAAGVGPGWAGGDAMGGDWSDLADVADRLSAGVAERCQALSRWHLAEQGVQEGGFARTNRAGDSDHLIFAHDHRPGQQPQHKRSTWPLKNHRLGLIGLLIGLSDQNERRRQNLGKNMLLGCRLREGCVLRECQVGFNPVERDTGSGPEGQGCWQHDQRQSEAHEDHQRRKYV